jgi:hypothetical protein
MSKKNKVTRIITLTPCKTVISPLLFLRGVNTNLKLNYTFIFNQRFLNVLMFHLVRPKALLLCVRDFVIESYIF